jgi:hypothetical protein
VVPLQEADLVAYELLQGVMKANRGQMRMSMWRLQSKHTMFRYFDQLTLEKEIEDEE